MQLTKVLRSSAEMAVWARGATAERIAEAIPMGQTCRRNLAYTNATCSRVNGELLATPVRSLIVDGEEFSVVRSKKKTAAASAAGNFVTHIGAFVIAKEKFDCVLKNDIGRVVGWDTRKSVLQVEFEVRQIDVPFHMAGFLACAFCITIHKSQSCTIRSDYCIHDVPVILKSGNAHALMYTAVTRAGEGTRVFRA